MRAAVFTFLLLLCSRLAFADEGAMAEQMFIDGRAAYDAERYDEAYKLFKESQRLDPAVGTELSLALSAKAIGKLSESWRLANHVLDELPAGDARAPVAEALKEELDQRLPRLTLTFAGRASVSLDGVALMGPSIGTAIPVDPGTHVATVRAPDHEDRETTITMVEGETRTVALALGRRLPSPVPTAAPTPSSDRDSGPAAAAESGLSGWSVAGITLLGVGAAGLITMGVMAGLVVDRDGVVEDNCDDVLGCNATAFEAADDGTTFSTVGTVSFALGATAVAAGGLLVILDAVGVFDASESAARSATLMPIPGGGMLMIGVVR